MAMMDTVSRLYSTVSLYFRLLILRAALFVRQSIEYRTAPAAHSSRTLLVLGDAVAMGLGDSIGSLGVISRLPQILRREREESGIRLYWHAVTAGILGSKAKDWLPGAPKKLFENTLIRGMFKKANVVVIVLGAHDDLLNEGKQTAEAVARIAEGVVRLGKHCIVSTFGNEYPAKSENHAKVRETNAILKTALQDVKDKNTAPHCGSISWNIEMAKIYALGNDVISFENDFFTPNSAGYRLLAREVYEAFIPAAKKVEWEHWKHKLSR